MSERRVCVFFYGLFMDEAMLRSRGLAPTEAQAASVDGWALRIGRRAALVPQDGSVVHGIAMHLTHAEIERLYGDESVAQYRPEPVIARLADKRDVAALCWNLPVAPGPGERNEQYAAKLREVARRAGLPEGYVAAIR
jgi:hypothetical protein